MIVIKDMEMPKKCGECGIYVCYRTWHGDPGDEFCGLIKKSVKYKTKPEWCPLSEVPERKTGKWVGYDGDWLKTMCKCSECGAMIDINEKYRNSFCYHCGAKMDGEQE